MVRQREKLPDSAGQRPIDSVGEASDDGVMEARLAKLKPDVAVIKVDVTVIKTNGATKTDIAELRSELNMKFAVLRDELNTKFAQLRVEVQFKSVEQQTATESEFSVWRTDMDATFAELQAGIKADLEEAKWSIIIWAISALFLSQLIVQVLEMFDK